jgi:hypothetical protein
MGEVVASSVQTIFILACLAVVNKVASQTSYWGLVGLAAHWGTVLVTKQEHLIRRMQGERQVEYQRLILAIFRVWEALQITEDRQITQEMDLQQHCDSSNSCWHTSKCCRDQEQNRTISIGWLCHRVQTEDLTSPWLQKTFQHYREHLLRAVWVVGIVGLRHRLRLC